MVNPSEDAAEHSTESHTVWVPRLVSRCYLTLIKLERTIPRSIPPFKSLCGYAQWCFDSPIDSKSATVLWQVMSIIDVCTEVRRLWPRNQDLIVLGKINKVSRKVLALKTPYCMLPADVLGMSATTSTGGSAIADYPHKFPDETSRRWVSAVVWREGISSKYL